MASSTAPQRCEVLDIEDTHERVRLCTCGESKNGLLCDDSHVKLNARTNANVQPIELSRSDLKAILTSMPSSTSSASSSAVRASEPRQLQRPHQQVQRRRGECTHVAPASRDSPQPALAELVAAHDAASLDPADESRSTDDDTSVHDRESAASDDENNARDCAPRTHTAHDRAGHHEGAHHHNHHHHCQRDNRRRHPADQHSINASSSSSSHTGGNRASLPAPRRQRRPHHALHEAGGGGNESHRSRRGSLTSAAASAASSAAAASDATATTRPPALSMNDLEDAPEHVPLPSLLSSLFPIGAALVARATGSLPVIARAELAKHKTRDSCWVMVGDYVYDVTEFLRFHPAGDKKILEYAGTDISYHVKFHSSAMMKIMRKHYLIGRLEPDPSTCIIV